MCMHTWDPELLNMDSEPVNKMISGQRKRGRMPHKPALSPGQDSVFLFESIHVSIHMYYLLHTLFPPNEHFTCFTTFSLYGNSFLQLRARALSLTTDLCGWDLGALLSLPNLSLWPGTEALLQIAAGQGYPRST